MDNKNTKKIVKLNPESRKHNPSKPSSTAMPELDSIEDRFQALGTSNGKLELEDNENNKRGESYYKQAMEAQRNNLEDVIHPPEHQQRLMANLVDYSLVGALFVCFNMFVVEKMDLIARFNHNSRQMYLAIFFTAVFLVCFLPAVFMKTTIGKKIFKIKIRGKKYYNPNPFQIFLREALLKPISIIGLFGVYIFFTEKESSGLHSLWSATTLTLD